MERAEKIVKRNQDSAKDEGVWIYHSYPHEYERRCGNPICRRMEAKENVGFYLYDETKDETADSDMRSWCETCFPNREEVIKQENRYLTESKNTRYNRACKREEWYEVEAEKNECYDSADCWYTGKHRHPAIIFRLKGSDITLCDVCMDNGRNSSYSINRAIDIELDGNPSYSEEDEE